MNRLVKRSSLIVAAMLGACAPDGALELGREPTLATRHDKVALNNVKVRVYAYNKTTGAQMPSTFPAKFIMFDSTDDSQVMLKYQGGATVFDSNTYPGTVVADARIGVFVPIGYTAYYKFTPKTAYASCTAPSMPTTSDVYSTANGNRDGVPLRFGATVDSKTIPNLAGDDCINVYFLFENKVGSGFWGMTTDLLQDITVINGGGSLPTHQTLEAKAAVGGGAIQFGLNENFGGIFTYLKVGRVVDSTTTNYSGNVLTTAAPTDSGLQISFPTEYVDHVTDNATEWVKKLPINQACGHSPNGTTFSNLIWGFRNPLTKTTNQIVTSSICGDGTAKCWMPLLSDDLIYPDGTADGNKLTTHPMFRQRPAHISDGRLGELTKSILNNNVAQMTWKYDFRMNRDVNIRATDGYIMPNVWFKQPKANIDHVDIVWSDNQVTTFDTIGYTTSRWYPGGGLGCEGTSHCTTKDGGMDCFCSSGYDLPAGTHKMKRIVFTYKSPSISLSFAPAPGSPYPYFEQALVEMGEIGTEPFIIVRVANKVYTSASPEPAVGTQFTTGYVFSAGGGNQLDAAGVGSIP